MPTSLSSLKPAGLVGPQGPTGAGAQGTQGIQGVTGIQGIQGITGAGTQGAQGITGTAGTQGAQGITGTAGTQGAQGIQGITGAGTQGTQGITGAQGIQGITGSSGGSSPWTVKTSTYTAVNGDRLLADTSATTFTITLPSSPVAGWFIEIDDPEATWDTNNLTVARNGANISSLAEDLVCNFSTKLSLTYVDATIGWKVNFENELGSVVPENTWKLKVVGDNNYTLIDRDRVIADTSGGAFTMVLPASPTIGMDIVIFDPKNAWPTNNLTISRNGSNIESLAENLVCNLSAKISLTFVGGTVGWNVNIEGELGGAFSGASVETTSGAYALVLGDTGKWKRTLDNTAVTVTVPAQVTVAWPDSAEIYLEQAGTGQITVAAASGVVVNGAGGLKSRAQFSVLGLKRVTSNVWTVFGDTTS